MNRVNSRDIGLGDTSPRGAAGSILVVDDDPGIRDLLKAILARNGFNISLASSSEEAITLMTRNDFGVVLLDVNLPGITGQEILSICKERLPYTEVIMMTSEPQFDSALAMVRKGAFDYIPKSFTPASILEKVRAAMQLRSKIITSDLERLSKSNEKLSSKFKFVRSLGSGAMGDVFLIESAGVSYALKKYRPFDEIAGNPARMRNKFLRVNGVLSAIKHPNVIRVYDYRYPEDGQSPYLVMEYVEGRPLTRLVGDSSISLEAKFDLTRQLASALSCVLDSGVIHRDIKPGNVLLDASSMTAKLTDFGIANMLDSALAGTEDFRGSPAYMAPECFNAAGICSLYSDVFSLGVLTYELITGKRPFSGGSIVDTMTMICTDRPTDPSLHLKDIPQTFKNVMASMLQKDPASRCHPERLALALQTLLSKDSGSQADVVAAEFDTEKNRSLWKT